MKKVKANLLKDLRVNEVSLVTKGAIGEVFNIVKSESPVDILKSLMTNPETMDEADKEILGEMGEEDYKGYVDEFAQQFVDDLESQGVDVAKFINGMVEEKTGKSSETPENDSEEKENESTPEKKVQKGIMDKISDVAKSLFKSPETENKESVSEEVVKEDDEMNAQVIAEAISKALEPVVKTVGELNEKVSKIETDRKEAEVQKSEEDKKESEVQKSDAEVIAEIVAKSLEPITKSVQAVTEKVEAIEKQEKPSQKIEGGDDVKKSDESKPFWGSFQIKK